MRLFEFSDDQEGGAYDPTMDRIHSYHANDTRKPKLTLRHLNKLRKMREAKKLDMHNRKKVWQQMYSAPSEEPMPGGPGLGF